MFLKLSSQSILAKCSLELLNKDLCYYSRLEETNVGFTAPKYQYLKDLNQNQSQNK